MSAEANKKLIQQVFTNSANRSGTTFIDHLADDAVWSDRPVLLVGKFHGEGRHHK